MEMAKKVSILHYPSTLKNYNGLFYMSVDR